MNPVPKGRSRAPALLTRLFPLLAPTLPVVCVLFSGVLHGLSGPFAAEPARPPAGKKPPARSLVLITVEGLRPDYLSCYAKGRGKPTPRIDELAAESRLFEQVVAPSVSSLPSLATLHTGKTPFQHQVWDDTYRNRLSEKELTLAEQLKAKGYRTGAFLGTSRAAPGRGLDQGFEIYQDGYVPPSSGTWKLALRSSRTVLSGARGWLAGNDGPFFLWVHLVDPIVPGHGTAEQPATDLEEAYVGHLGELDEQIGVLLDVLKQRKDYESLIIALTADHGFGLGDHGESRAGVFLYEGTLRVPLILRTPGPDAGKGSKEPQLSGLIDLYPTLARLLDIPEQPGLSGRDLLAPGAASSRSFHATALFGRETFGWAGGEALAQGKWRLLLTPQAELYDVVADPGETRDLSSSLPEEVSRLKEAIKQLSGGESIPPAHFQVGPVPAASVASRLKQMKMSAPTLERAMARPLPEAGKFRDSLLLLEEMVLRWEIFGNPILTKVQEPMLKADPEALFTLLVVGALNVNAGEEPRKRAATLLHTAQELYPLEPEAYHQLGHLAFPAKKWSEAIFFLQTALALRPLYPGEVVYDLACADALKGDKVEALKQLRESIRLGFREFQFMGKDPDLESLRGEAGYKKLMEEEFQAPLKP